MMMPASPPVWTDDLEVLLNSQLFVGVLTPKSKDQQFWGFTAVLLTLQLTGLN
jgi:hypothetical protein